MKNGIKIYQKIRKIKSNLKNDNILKRKNYDNQKLNTEYKKEYPDNLIKCKSLSKIKSKNFINPNEKTSNIKLPSIVQNISKSKSKSNSKNKSKSILTKKSKNSKVKLKISTENLHNIKNMNKNSNPILPKHCGSSFNLKIKKNSIIKTNNSFAKKNFDRKIKTKIKLNIPKKENVQNYKLYTTTKIINNFNNQFNSTKSKMIQNVKKLDVLFEIEKNVSKIQRYFRKFLERKYSNNLNIISDISLSEEELSFTEEESFESLEDFSLDEQEI